MKSKLLQTIIIISIFIIALGFLFLVIKLINYNEGIDGNVNIHGTFKSNIEDPTAGEYISIELNTGKYQYFKVNDEILAEGKIEQQEVGQYVLYEENSDIVYGKLIASFNKVYLIDKNLNITQLFKLSKVLILPRK